MKQDNHKGFHIFYGWWIVAAGFWLWLVTGGFIVLGFTAFFEPIADELGWSYTQISVAASFRGVELGLFAPVLGLLIDRWSPRKMLFGGVLLASAGMLMVSRINSLGMFYAGFLIMAVSMSFISPTVIFTPIANWFRRKLGIATAIAGSGFALGGLLVPLVVKLIDAYDWRNTLVILGIAIFVLCLPVSLLFRPKPEPYGYLPDGDEDKAQGDTLAPLTAEIFEADIRTKQALRSRPFWQIGIAMMFHTVAIATLAVHIMPFLSSIGISRTAAGLVTMSVPLLSIPGRIISGWLADRLNKRRVTTAFFLITSLGILCGSYASQETTWLLIPFVLLYGIGWGSNQTMRAAMLREYFGRSNFGAIFGFMMGVSAVGSILGPLFAGWVFDHWASYQIAWLTLASLTFAAVIVIAATPPANRVST